MAAGALRPGMAMYLFKPKCIFFLRYFNIFGRPPSGTHGWYLPVDLSISPIWIIYLYDESRPIKKWYHNYFLKSWKRLIVYTSSLAFIMTSPLFTICIQEVRCCYFTFNHPWIPLDIRSALARSVSTKLRKSKIYEFRLRSGKEENVRPFALP